jgi:hypothetical protein
MGDSMSDLLESFEILYTTNGTPFLINADDLEKVLTRKWFPSKCKTGTYIACNKRVGFYKNTNRSKYTTLRLHHLVFRKPGPGMVIDHINGDPQDNRRSNLQEISLGDNIAKQKQQDSGTKVRGVYRRPNGRFQACIRIDDVQKTLGTFDTAEEASSVHQRHHQARLKNIKHML